MDIIELIWPSSEFLPRLRSPRVVTSLQYTYLSVVWNTQRWCICRLRLPRYSLSSFISLQSSCGMRKYFSSGMAWFCYTCKSVSSQTLFQSKVCIVHLAMAEYQVQLTLMSYFLVHHVSQFCPNKRDCFTFPLKLSYWCIHNALSNCTLLAFLRIIQSWRYWLLSDWECHNGINVHLLQHCAWSRSAMRGKRDVFNPISKYLSIYILFIQYNDDRLGDCRPNTLQLSPCVWEGVICCFSAVLPLRLCALHCCTFITNI